MATERSLPVTSNRTTNEPSPIHLYGVGSGGMPRWMHVVARRAVCPRCGGTGFSGHGTGYDDVCDNCIGGEVESESVVVQQVQQAFPGATVVPGFPAIEWEKR